MTLAVLQASVLQTNGALSVAAGAQITVRTPAGALATLYEDRAGTTPTGANPIFADSKGFFRVYVAPGRYDVTVTASSGTQVYEDIALFAEGVALGTAAVADMLGTVSATGTYPNLVPTGAIMEAGSNANGQYVKYADGTMICRINIGDTGETISSVLQNGWYNSVLNYSNPATFVGGTVRLASSDTRLGSVIRYAHWTVANNALTCSSLSEHNRHVRIEIVVIGRWK